MVERDIVAFDTVRDSPMLKLAKTAVQRGWRILTD
jgi:hypothetical protein